MLVGGETWKEMVYEAMKYVISPDLGNHFTFHGMQKKNTRKLAFKKLAVARIVKGVVYVKHPI